MSHFSGNNTCKSTIIYVNIKINKEIKLKTITMATNPPLKSAQNKPKTLGASAFTQKYGSMVPKRVIDSPYDKHIIKSGRKSSKQLDDLEKDFPSIHGFYINK